jgi:DNA-binding MarR family transcriptional regulator
MPNDFDLEKFLPYRLNRAADAVSAGFGAIYRERHGMTRPEWRTMALLGAYGHMTATDISRRSAMHKTKVSRAVQSLEDRGWLRRKADDDDRRVDHLELTASGQETYGGLTEVAVRFEADLRERLGAEAISALLAALDAIEARRATAE